MKLSQIAIQLYTLRDFCQTAEDLAQTLGKVRAIGYEAVQVSGVGPIPPSEIAQICADHGLAICATHEASTLLRTDPAAAIARLQAYGTTQTAYPFPAGVDFADPASVESLLSDLTRAGEAFAAAGCTLSYHNHAIEFIRYGETNLLDHIRRTVPADVLAFELDTYWVQYGGADPVRWCEALPGRLPLLHLKDYQFTTANTPTYCEVGAGNLDFPRIIAAAEASGCQWFIVEQDTCPGDPFVSIAQSFAYLRDHIVS